MHDFIGLVWDDQSAGGIIDPEGKSRSETYKYPPLK
jgi:hypothetical protein